MFTVVLQPETQSPEVYRNTPFEHFSTADTGQVLFVYATPIWHGRTQAAPGVKIAVRPTTPRWMRVGQIFTPVDEFESFELTLPA